MTSSLRFWLVKCREIWDSAPKTASRFTSKLSDPGLILGEPHLLLTVTLCVLANSVFLTRPKEQQKFRPLVVFIIFVSSSYVFRRLMPLRQLQNKQSSLQKEKARRRKESMNNEERKSLLDLLDEKAELEFRLKVLDMEIKKDSKRKSNNSVLEELFKI